MEKVNVQYSVNINLKNILICSFQYINAWVIRNWKDYEGVVFLGLSVDSLYNEEHLLTQTLHIEQNIAQSLPITELHNLNQGR